jgi:hypothetical protein
MSAEAHAALIEQAACVERDLERAAASIQAFERSVALCRTEAFSVGGQAGAEDVSSVAGADRVAEEIMGVMVANGMGHLLAVARLHEPRALAPVADFTARWRQRAESGRLETTRRTRT